MKNRAKIYTFLLIVALLFQVFSIFSFSVPSVKADGEGWLTGWDYRKSHAINSATGAGTNYQVNVTVHYGSGSDSTYQVYLDSKCKTDFGDIRFTDNDGSTELDYWMQEKTDSDNAIFWAEVTDDLSSSTVTIYIYYGKSDATTTSNFDNTFIFGDPFDSDTLDTGRWPSVDGNPTYTIDDTNHYLEVTDMDQGWWTGLGFHSRTDLSFPSTYIVENAYTFLGMTISQKSDIVQELHGTILSIHDDVWGVTDYGSACGKFLDDMSGEVRVRKTAGVGGDEDWTQYFTGSTATWYSVVFRIWKLSGNIKVEVDSTERVDEANTDTPDRVHLGLARLTGYAFGTMRFYSFKIRKYVDPEPTHDTWGEEEEPSTGPIASNIASNATQAGDSCLFSASWSDSDGLSGYIFGTNNTGSWTNDTWTSFSGGTWSNVTKTLTSDADTYIEWQIWANDTLNDWGDTSVQHLTTTDTSDPEVVPDDEMPEGFEHCSNRVANATATIAQKWRDKGKLHGYIFGWNSSGTFSNDTWQAWGTPAVEAWANVTKKLNETKGIMIKWRMWANDTKDNWGDTGDQNFNTTACYLNFDWQDRDGASIPDSQFTWQLWNATSNMEYTQDEASLIATNYTLKSFRYGLQVDSETIDTGPTGTQNATYTATIGQMKKHESTNNAWIMVNNSVSSLIIISETSTNLAFTISGSTPMKFWVDVHKEPSWIKKDGILLDGWSYDSGSAYCLWISASLSIFEFLFEQEGSSGSQETPQNETWRYKLRVTVTLDGEPVRLCNVSITNLNVPYEYTDALGVVTFTLPLGTYKVLAWHPDYGYKAETVTMTDHTNLAIDMKDATPEPPEEDRGWWGNMQKWFENILKERKINARTLSWLALPIIALGAFMILRPKDRKKRKFSYSYLKKKKFGR